MRSLVRFQLAPREGLPASAPRARDRRCERRVRAPAGQGRSAAHDRRLAGAGRPRVPVSVALIVGVGAVGTRAARQLVDTAGIDRLLVADRDAQQAKEIADALGDKAQPIDHEPGDAIPDGVDVVATAIPAELDHAVLTAAIAAGVPAASCTDEHDAIDQLRALDLSARTAGATIALGCGLAPGLVDVLARHVSTMFDE